MTDLLTLDALDQRLAIVGTSGAGKTYAAKGQVERLLRARHRVCIVDPLGVWWGLRAGRDGAAEGGFEIAVFGGRHADLAIGEAHGAPLARAIGEGAFSCIVDLSELGSSAARRRFMAAFAETLYDANREPLQLVFDEADLFAPQRPLPEGMALLGRMEEIVRRGRVRGFIPWLITQRPAVLHKDVLSQADVLIAMKLTASQDRDAIGAWIEGQADRAEGKRILGELPRLAQGEGYLWAPGMGILERTRFPALTTFDSSRTPKRGERARAAPTLAAVDLMGIGEALAKAEAESKPEQKAGAPSEAALETARQAGYAEGYKRGWQEGEETLRQAVLAALGAKGAPAPASPAPRAKPAATERPLAATPRATRQPGDLPPAARKLILVLVRHAPARFTWTQAATLAGLKARGGHFNAGRKALRENGLLTEEGDLIAASPSAVEAHAGEVPPAPQTFEETIALWKTKLPSPAPEMLDFLAARRGRSVPVEEMAQALGKQPRGGHWNGGIAALRNNGLAAVAGGTVTLCDLGGGHD